MLTTYHAPLTKNSIMHNPLPQSIQAFFFAAGLTMMGLLSIAYADGSPDYEREKRMAEQIVDNIFSGEPIWLEANEHTFLAIHTINEDAPKGSVVILHGRGYHPDWPEVAGPLRTGLVDAGWSTLSVQMPVLEKGKKYYDYLPLFQFAHQRIKASISYLREQSDLPVVLLAHSCGAHMANDWFNHNDDTSIDGYVILGAGATDYGQEIQTDFPFAKMDIPIFDLYGANEFPRPITMLSERRELLKQGGNAQSKQQSLPNADHYFHDSGPSLTQAVADWLNNTNFSIQP